MEKTSLKMKSFSIQSSARVKIFSDGRAGIDSIGAISNLASLTKVDWHRQLAQYMTNALISR